VWTQLDDWDNVFEWTHPNVNPNLNLYLGTISPGEEWEWSNVGDIYTWIRRDIEFVLDASGLNSTSPDDEWVWSIVEEGSLDIWPTYGWLHPDVNPNLNLLIGTVSPEGEWTWGTLNDNYMWIQISSPTVKNLNMPRQIENVVGEWEEKYAEIVVPEDWNLEKPHSFAVDTNFGDEGVMWISNLKFEYIFSSTIIDNPIYAPFEANITAIVSNDLIYTDKSWDELALEVGHVAAGHSGMATYPYNDWTITYKTGDVKNLITLLNFGDNNLQLTVNHKKDDVTATQYPHSIVYKLYEPLEDVVVGDLCWVVKEMLPQHEEIVSLVPFVEDKINAVVLRQPLLSDVENPIDTTEGKYQSKETILTSNSEVSTKLRNLILSRSLDSVDLNIEYGQFENFVHFSSAGTRITNFKSKLTTIDGHLASSASLALTNTPTTSSLTAGIKVYENKIYEIENALDPFEKYMYFESSSYVTSSNGQFFSNSWPKQNSSTPYTHYAVTSSEAVAWYTTTLASASLYDLGNRDRLVHLTPIHVGDDSTNVDYMTFLNMMGHYFDEIWVYIKAMSDIHVRDDKLTSGLSKDLVYPVAKSLGWDLYNGKSLISLPKYKLGFTVTGSTYSTTSVISEEDISKEIWNRLINNMPFFMKAKGTKRALQGLINCYGIPSTILRIKEYGGPEKTGAAPSYEITRKFTKAIDFKGSQYVQTTWVADTNSGRKPDTVEFRFKSATGSNQTLMNVGSNWGIYLKDNGSNDNYGSVIFALSGSSGYQEVSSSQMPVYDGDFYSVMVNRNVIPSVASTVSSSAFVYDDTRISLTSVSSFATSGQFTTINSGGLTITFTYTSKNTYTNELIGITGWPRRAIKAGDAAVATGSIALATIVNQVNPLTTDSNNQEIKYELAVKKYNSGTSKIYLDSVSGMTISGSMGALSESYNAAFSSSGTAYIGGSSGNAFGSQFSGSMMEFRYWNSALNMSAFDNHVGAPKSFNGNHASASYTDLVLRYSFDDNINHSVNDSVRDTSADQSYIQTGSAVGFANETNYSNVEDEQKMFTPNIGPNRNMASKIRLETNNIVPESDGNRLLSSNIRKEKSSYDTAPIDSNLLGVYFAPTDVINEDIIMSVADLDFGQYIGDPRDISKQTYKDLNSVADSYWQKYTSPNNFWDYMRLIRYYDNSLFSQLQRLIPFRASSRVGILIEPNILERSKVVISEKIEWTNHSYEDTIDVSTTTTLTGSEDYHSASLAVGNTLALTGSESYFAGSGSNIWATSASYDAYVGSASYYDTYMNPSGSYDLHRGYIGYDIDMNYTFDGNVFQSPSKYILTGSYYQSGSLGKGTPLFIFEEAYEPNVTGSRISEHSMVQKFYYSSRFSQSIDNYHSSSLAPAEYNVLLSRSMLNLYYEGCEQTKDTTTDGGLPVEVTITSPTVLVTKEPGESKLKVK